MSQSHILWVLDIFSFVYVSKKKKETEEFLVDYFLGTLRFVCLAGKELNHV